MDKCTEKTPMEKITYIVSQNPAYSSVFIQNSQQMQTKTNSCNPIDEAFRDVSMRDEMKELYPDPCKSVARASFNILPCSLQLSPKVPSNRARFCCWPPEPKENSSHILRIIKSFFASAASEKGRRATARSAQQG
jgi:hypothetical protein